MSGRCGLAGGFERFEMTAESARLQGLFYALSLVLCAIKLPISQQGAIDLRIRVFYWFDKCISEMEED